MSNEQVPSDALTIRAIARRVAKWFVVLLIGSVAWAIWRVHG